MKKITTLFLGMAFGTVLQADNYSIGDKFLGIEVGAATIQGAVYTDFLDPLTYNPMFEGSDVTYGLRFGAQNDEYRSTILFDYYDSVDEDQTLQLGLVTVDYYVLSRDAAAVKIKPYIGINLGYLRYESTLVDESGFAYGGQAGVAASVSSKIDIDVAYRYSLALNTHTMDHFGAFMVGLNYLY